MQSKSNKIEEERKKPPFEAFLRLMRHSKRDKTPFLLCFFVKQESFGRERKRKRDAKKKNHDQVLRDDQVAELLPSALISIGKKEKKIRKSLPRASATPN